jgi:hypothetical protein
MSNLRPQIRNPEAALTIPPPPSSKNHRLKTLVEMGYVSLETITFEFEQIPTSKFARARRKVANADVLSPMHADLKAVATWFLRRRGYSDVQFEPRYPHGTRRADVASVPADYFVEVGHVADLSRIYHMLGMDVIMRGSSISSVLKRYPSDVDPTDGIQGIISIPFPVDDPAARAWDSDELEVHIFTRGKKQPSTSNRRHPWWRE